MASLVIPTDFYNLAIQWGGPGSGSQPVNVLGIQMDPAHVGVDVFNLATTIVDALVHPVADAYTVFNVQITKGDDAGAPYLTFGTGITHTGEFDVAPAPPNCSYLLSKNSSTPGRSGRGRMFLPGVDEGAVDGAGDVGGAAMAALSATVAELNEMPGVETNFIGFAIFHPEGSIVFTPSVEVTFTSNSKIATQRRRLRN